MAITVQLNNTPVTNQSVIFHGNTQNVGITQFDVGMPAGDGEGFCVDLAQNVSFGTVQYNVGNLTNTVGAFKADLIQDYYDTHLNNVTAKDFQLGLWEIWYDNTWSFSSGDFKVSNYNSNLINTVVHDHTAQYNLSYLVSNTKQDLVVATIPEPTSSVFIMISAIFAFGLSRFRNLF